MLGSDSGSSDLSEASSLSSDNSSGSEADIKDNPHQRQPKQDRVALLQSHPSAPATHPIAPSAAPLPPPFSAYQQHYPTSQQVPGRPIQPKYHSSSSSGSGSGSGSGDSSGDDSTDLDDDGNAGQGKRPPQLFRSSNKYPSKGAASSSLSIRKETEKLSLSKNAPISLSDSLPVYSQEIMDGSVMATTTTRNGTVVPGRGRGRGRGRGPLAGHGSRMHNASGATVIDFDASSPPPEDHVPSVPVQPVQLVQPPRPVQLVQSIHHIQHIPVPAPVVPITHPTVVPPAIAPAPTRKKKESPAERSMTKAVKSGSGSKPKTGAKKVGRPKTVSKDVYCICRGPYDGVEFMIACDRCEEWFHGRCIGMKPQEAKKSNYYYCDTCQRIRRMFGVTSSQEPTPAPKPKASRKKNTDKRSEKQSRKHDGSTTKLKNKAAVGAEQVDDFGSSYYKTENPMIGGVHSAPNMYKVSEPVQLQAQQSFPAKQAHLSSKSTKSKSAVMFQDRPAANVANHAVVSNPIAQATLAAPSYNLNNVQGRPFRFPSTPAVYDDDDDEDVCPVCEDECTCNNDVGGGIASAPVSTRASPEMNESHSMSAIKVPFQPNLGSVTTSPYPHSEPVDHPSIDIGDDDDDIYSDDAFQVSQKNPMVTPTSQRRPSILQRCGKGIGKMPSLMQSAKKAHHSQRKKGKSLKSGKASKHMYQHSMASSGSGDSDSFSEGEVKGEIASEGRRYSYVSDTNNFKPQLRYESGSDDIVEADDMLSMGSASSLSEFDDDGARDLIEQASSTNSMDHDTEVNRITSGKGFSTFRAVVPAEELGGLVVKPVVVIKRRGPGRPKKSKDPLVVSREDEQALYTPAVISRKIGDAIPQKRRSTKIARSSKVKVEFPFIAYDPEVAEDVKAVDTADYVGDNETTDALESATPLPDSTASNVFSDGDIFGDGDLSDELSGDLSDILSEDLDDLSDDVGLEFTSSDEEDDTSNGSSPREFHYSEMEEQDESLVDSDSSINSITSADSDSSEVDTESDVEPHSQGLTDLDELSGHEGSEELIDDEELMRLEEQERLYLAKAQLLHDVFSEDDSDPGRNPFESSEDEDDDGDDERSFEGEGEVYSDEFYEDDYYEDEYDDLDENAILEQLQGTQSDMQALLMIPPEQQEQLLLLQHYAETHRLQQEQLAQKSHELGQPILDQGVETQSHLSQQDAQVSGLLNATGLLPPFDVNVPDLDAVSEQLAASLANSLASSMAGKIASGQPEDAPLFPTTIQDISQIGQMGTDTAETTITSDGLALPANVLNVSPVSPESVTPDSGIAIWNVPLPSTPSSVNSTSASIPTPANTPTPPGTMVAASPNVVTGSSTALIQQASDLSTQDSATTSLASGLEKSSTKIQSLPNSPSYKPLTSVMSSPTIRGQQVQRIMPKLDSEESVVTTTQLANPIQADGIFGQTRLQNGDPSVFKAAAQRALGSLQSASSTKGISPQETVPTGDTTDDASPSMHSAEFRKRKGDEQKANEVVLVDGKRRRLSTAPIRGHLKLGTAPETQNAFPAFSSEITESLAALINNTAASSLSATPSDKEFSAMSASMSPINTGATGLRVFSSTTATGEGVTVAEYDFSRATIPFVDPTARIIASPSTQKQQHGSSSRSRKFSLKGKEPRHSDAVVLPMDDLLDTSALYGRSSSRSPSPDRGDGDLEMSQSMKDLNRWDRVPIGTFRRSRRPSSSYVGLQGALKFGNVTMPTTLLADHQQHQQQLSQESHRLHRRSAGVRKHRPPSSASDVMSGMPRREGRGDGLSALRSMHDRQLHGSHRARVAAISSVTQTPPSVHAGMLMEDLAGFGSPDATHRALGSKFPMQRSQSSLGSLEGSVRQLGSSHPMTGEPIRRRRRAGSSLLHTQQPGVRLGRSSSTSGHQQHSGLRSTGLEMALHHTSGLGIGMAGLVGSGGQYSTLNIGGPTQPSGLQDLMTDSSQLPSSACPTPLHSPLFSATNANGAVHHHGSGEPVVSDSQPSKVKGPSAGDSVISHLDLDISKEIEGFRERLSAKSKSVEDNSQLVVKSGLTNQSSQGDDEDVDVDIEDEDEEESLKAFFNANYPDYTYYNSMLVFPKGDYDTANSSRGTFSSTQLNSNGPHRTTIGVAKVTKGNQYDFEIVFSTSSDLLRKPALPLPPKNMDIIPLLLKDANSVDVCFTFASDKAYSNIGLWAHSVVLARHKVFSQLIQQQDALHALVMSNEKDNKTAVKVESDAESPRTVTAEGTPTPSPINETRSIVIKVDKFSLATFCSLLYYIYTDEVHLAIDTDRFAISSGESSLTWNDTTTGKTRNSLRWHPTDPASPWRLKDVTWDDLLEASDHYGISDLRTNCLNKVISGMSDSNVVGTLFSKAVSGSEVRQAAMEYIVNHWEVIFQKGKSDPFGAYREHPNCHEVLIELMQLKAKNL
ncbi:hypothetical protein EC991_002232 [Linnemannia zychae]|nr:hypothetical protein EC991_002232 [Linnemannia zychae]